MSGEPAITNVLLVSGGGFQGLTLLKGLLEAGDIRVVVADCYQENICRYFAHRSYVVPRIDQDGFLTALLNICHTEDIHIVFPCTEMELASLAANAEAFLARGVHLAISTSEFLETVCDKKLLYSLLEQEGLPAPHLIDISAGELDFPLLGKPRSGWGGKGHVLLESPKDLDRYCIKDLQDNYVWQYKLQNFREHSIDFGIALNGRISPICVRERLRVSGGFAVIAASDYTKRFSDIGEAFARMASRKGGVGIFNIQVISAGDDCFISDVNPRMGTSAVFDYGVGINLPAFVCSSSNERQSPPADMLAEPVTMVRHLEESFVRKQTLDGIRGFVFDLDDTLVNQKRWILEKLHGILPAVKARVSDEQLFLVRAMQLLEEGNRSNLLDAVGRHFGFTTEFCAELIGAYRNSCPKEAHVFPDVWPLVHELKRRGFQLAILTNNPPNSQRQKITAAGFGDCFDVIVYTQELKAEKPCIEAFLEASARLKLSPNELVMVGDNLYSDIEAALRSGYRHSFFIQRQGGFYNFDFGVFEKLTSFGKCVTKISSLRDVLRYLTN